MPSRQELNRRARVLGIDPALYVNDSQLEQRVIYDEVNAGTVAGTLANTTLTSDATNNADGETITIGAIVYTFKTALTEVAASITLTSNNTNVSDGDTVQINTQTYRFKTTLVRPGDIQIGASADASLTSLANAINAAGTPGTDYATGTPSLVGSVSSSAVASHILTLTAAKVGTFGNSFIGGTTAATLTFGNSGAFASGVNPVPNQILIGASASASLDNVKSAINGTAGSGTTYSSGTIAHPQVTAGVKTATTLVVTAIKAASNLTLASTSTATHLSWTAATVGNNVQAIVANPAYSANSSGGALV